MKTLGIIGGTTWHSTVDYYKIINQEVNRRLGKSHSGKILIKSFDFEEIAELQGAGQLHEIEKMVLEAGHQLQGAGAELLLFAANTMHMYAEKFEEIIPVPLIHIVDATATAIKKTGCKKVALLGTKFTMQMDFFKERLRHQNIETFIPAGTNIEKIHSIILSELALGDVRPDSKEFILACIGEMTARGAEGIILGCTEFPMLIQKEDVALPLFDTTHIHCVAAVDSMLKL